MSRFVLNDDRFLDEIVLKCVCGVLMHIVDDSKVNYFPQ